MQRTLGWCAQESLAALFAQQNVAGELSGDGLGNLSLNPAIRFSREIIRRFFMQDVASRHGRETNPRAGLSNQRHRTLQTRIHAATIAKTCLRSFDVADISIKRAHHGTLADARKMADKVAVKLEKDYQLKSTWAGDVMNFARSGVNGTLAISAKDLTIDIKLGFLAGAFKGTIQDAVEKNLDSLIKPAKPGVVKEAVKPVLKKTARN